VLRVLRSGARWVVKAWAWYGACGVAAAALGAVLAGCGATRAGYETARHDVVAREGKFELRDYPATRLASTRMPLGEDSGFMRLFRFISGANERGEKIAMTTPVFMERGVGDGQDTMAFVLPEAMTNAPRPSSADVTLGSMEGGRFAVHRFAAGRPDAAVEAGAERRLREWMAGRRLGAEGRAMFAYFDPPWIPRWFRRNEVMLRVGSGP